MGLATEKADITSSEAASKATEAPPAATSSSDGLNIKRKLEGAVDALIHSSDDQVSAPEATSPATYGAQMPTETQSGLNIKRKLEGAVDALIHSGETENADMAGLASASHANPAVDTAAQSPADSQAGLNIKRKLESAVDALIHSEEPADPAGSSAATSVASPAQSEIQAGLNIKRTLESAVDALIQSSGSESADMEGLAAAGHANPTADQPQFFTQASGLNVKRKLESAVDALIASDEAPLEQSPAESLERSKFTLKKTSEAASATPAATEAPAKKAKTVAMHERPHYR